MQCFVRLLGLLAQGDGRGGRLPEDIQNLQRVLSFSLMDCGASLVFCSLIEEVLEEGCIRCYH
jgi:hypothetical protein